MLQSIREKSQGWLAWVIVGLISIPFALWGINSYFDGGANVSVAEVNGKKIGLSQFQNGMQTYRQQLQAMFGSNIDINSLDQNAIKQTVVNGLVEQELLRQTGEGSGMRVSDSLLSSVISTLAPFQDESGKFSNAVYESQLRQSGINPGVFQQQLREEVLQDQLRRGISESAFVTSSERKHIQQLQEQQRNIVYSIIDAELLKETIDVSEEEISDYYAENKENYKTEASVKIQYIDLSVDELAKNIEVSDEALEEYYKANLDQFTVQERRVAEHVFISLAPGASDEEVKKANQSANKIYELIKDGIKFDDIPEKHSDLLGDNDEVAKTGDVLEGAMEPEFDDALFSLTKGEISEPVRTANGFHIIKLEEIKPATVESFAEAKAGVEQMYRLEKAQASYYEVADELQNLAFENPDSLEIAAEALDVEIKKAGPFTQSKGEGITREPKVLSAAFSEEVLDGVNSEPLEITDEHLIVLRSEDYQPARVKELSEVTERIKQTLIDNKARQQAEDRGTELLVKLNDGADLDQLAKDESFEWTKKEAVTRDDPQVQRAVLRTAYRVGKPESGKPVFSGMTIGLNNYAIVGVLDVFQPADKKDLKEESRAGVSKQVEALQKKRETSSWQDFVSSLKDRSEINIFSESL